MIYMSFALFLTCAALSSAFVQLLFALRPHLPVGGLLKITLVKTGEQAEVTFIHPRYEVSTDEYNAAAMYYWSAVQQFASALPPSGP